MAVILYEFVSYVIITLESGLSIAKSLKIDQSTKVIRNSV